MAKARSQDNTDDQMLLSGFEEETPPAKTTAPAQATLPATEVSAVKESEPARQVREPEPSGERDEPSGGLANRGENPEQRKARHAAVAIDGDSLPAVLQREIVPAADEPTPDLTDKLVVVVDAHSLIYQVFHALPPMTSSGGLPVNAVYGFVGDMLELVDRKQPDYLIAAFDKSEVTFRNELFPQYKANRDSMPDELRQQIPLIRQAIDAMGIGIMEQGGFEADDLLATVSAKVEAAGGRCLVVTSDKDCRQLITDKTLIYNIRKNEEIDAAKLWDLWGVRPDQVIDYQSLVGDPVDNVPGISLIGPKLAKQLLEHRSCCVVIWRRATLFGKCVCRVWGRHGRRRSLRGTGSTFLIRPGWGWWSKTTVTTPKRLHRFNWTMGFWARRHWRAVSWLFAAGRRCTALNELGIWFRFSLFWVDSESAPPISRME